MPAMTLLTAETASAYVIDSFMSDAWPMAERQVPTILSVMPVDECIEIHFCLRDQLPGMYSVWIRDGEIYGEW